MRVLRSITKAPSLVKTGAACGILGGLAIGAMVSTPEVGLFFGVVLGAGAGIIAGIVMDHDAQRSMHRTRELDDIIGVTSGSLGAPPSIPPPSEAEVARERDAELRSWVTEWMTPPPPSTSY